MNCSKAILVTGRTGRRGFFDLFYEWSAVTCTARPLHTLSCSAVQARPSRAQNSSRRNLHSDAVLKPTPKPGSSDEPVLSHHLRHLMRTMPHSVVVCTSTSSSTPSASTASNYKGMTVSSFTTLTLTPQPIVTFNIRKPSQTLNAIRDSRRFLIHILSETESGAKVADAFTKGNGIEVWQNNAFKVLKIRGKGTEPPLLSAAGITKVLRCELLQNGPGDGLVEVGDHTLVLGKVVSIIEAEKKGGIEEDRGLCYLDRQYRHVGEVIEVGHELNNN